MGKITVCDPVKCIMGILFNRVYSLDHIVTRLDTVAGPVDLQSPVTLFDHTDYYREEMGEVIYRVYVSFEELIMPDDLVRIKSETNELECEMSEHNQRHVNLDPGYVELGKLVLASTKNYTHRIYIGSGIYAEPTLHFYKGSFAAWPFSYPDYAAPATVAFFVRVRDLYKQQLHSLK